MQSIGHSLACLGTARVLLAGAAILAGAAGPLHDHGNPAEETALAIPRVSTTHSREPVAPPQPLSPNDAQHVRRIFALQAKNDLAGAIAEGDQLSDQTLLGDILADRYLRGRATPEQLTAWLANYGELAQAPAIYASLVGITPKNGELPPAPPAIASIPALTAGEDVEPTIRLMARNAGIDRTIHDTARTDANRALTLIGRVRGLAPAYAAQLRAEVAQILFTQGRDQEALAAAQSAHLQARGKVGLASYVGGLAAWRLGRPALARLLFASAYQSTLIQPGQRAAAAYWAARADLRGGRGFEYVSWLRRAAEQPRTFYGLLARRVLGEPLTEPGLDRATLAEADVDVIASLPGGRRVFALLQVGQEAHASLELQKLWSEHRDSPALTRSILLLARSAGLTELAGQFESVIAAPTQPLPARLLRPAGGFRTDPALLYALARMESNFDPQAVSPMGARGLLQLMPSTLAVVLGETGGRVQRLHDPAVNLDLGQRYLNVLTRYDVVGADLIRLLATYNAGVGSVGRWSGTMRHDGDPLLFIESVPGNETRAYIPRVLAYSWLYAAQLGLPSPSLDELAAGQWPRFRTEPPRLAALH
jgi:soluble lytic murein transglycosylase-like protein